MPKLDRRVCRGTLITHRGVLFVVISERPTTYYNLSVKKGWKIASTEQLGKGVVREVVWVEEFQEVDSFFPGVVYPLPDYIR